MSQTRTLTVDTAASEAQPAAAVAPHPAPAAPRASAERKHEPSEAVRASVDRLIDQANRFAQQNDQETPQRLRASFQFD